MGLPRCVTGIAWLPMVLEPSAMPKEWPRFRNYFQKGTDLNECILGGKSLLVSVEDKEVSIIEWRQNVCKGHKV